MQTTTIKSTKNGAPAQIQTVRPKVKALIDAMTKLFREREQVILGIWCAILAKEHAYLVGPPGTGKSAISRAISNCLGASYFEWLMTRFTTPEEILGPMSLSALKQDKLTRIATGKLPDAQVVFLDEIFKANSACLNAILAAVNERIFHDDGQAKVIPLRTCIGASNELPDGSDLEALNDRFLMRFFVDELVDQTNWVSVVSEPEPEIDKSLHMTLAEIDAAIAEVEQVTVPEDVVVQLFEVRDQLSREGIRVSTRRWKKLIKILRAYAWITGASEVDSLHFEILQHGLWRDPSQRQKIVAIVGKVSSPILSEATSIYDSMMELIGGLPATGPVESAGRSTMGELKKGIQKITEVRAKSDNPALTSRIERLVTELSEEHAKLRDRLMKEMDLT